MMEALWKLSGDPQRFRATTKHRTRSPTHGRAHLYIAGAMCARAGKPGVGSG